MLTMRTLLFTFFVYASFAVALTNAAYFRARSSQGDSTGDENVETTFTRLLSAVSPRALHQLLHEYAPNTFKQGAFSSDHHTVEATHPRSPAMVSTIVHLAVRQATSGNDTTTTDAPTSTDSSTDSSSSTPSTTSDTPSTTSTDEPTTTSTEQTPTETTETPQDTPTSSSTLATTPTSTSTSTPASATETTETTDTTDTPSRTSSSSWHTSAFSSNVDSSITSTFSTSTTPTPTSKTSTFTSTLPGGIVTTVTEVAVVTPGVTDRDSTPTTDIGNLQTDSPAPIVRGPRFEILAGFLVGGIMLA
ncbi:hypothetical protein GGR58DRAFT_487497 [Xylaria digitata]|nr:hypothetical protein GGR58DRAFT_487497 [Xylaria digitata]